jgi:hypothetical protein
MTAARRQRALMYARLLEMRWVFGSRRARIATELDRQRLVLRGHLFRVLLTVRSAFVGLAATSGRRRSSRRAHVVGMERASRSGVDRLRTSRPKLSLHERRARHVSHGREYVAGVRVAPLPKSGLSSRDLQRPRTAWTTPRAPARSGFLRAAGVVAAGIAVMALAGIAVVATRSVGSNRENNAAGSTRSWPAGQIGRGFLHFPGTSTPTDKAQTSSHAPRRAERPTARTVRHAESSVAKRLTLVSNTVQSASTPAAPTTGTAAPPSAGPSPLPAPPGASSPSPLKAPGR